jgi:hypothetical protein
VSEGGWRFLATGVTQGALLGGPETVQLPARLSVGAGWEPLMTPEARAGDGARTHDSHVGNADMPVRNLDTEQAVASIDTLRLHGPYTPADPDLARVLRAWPELPDHIKAAVLALLSAAGR